MPATDRRTGTGSAMVDAAKALFEAMLRDPLRARSSLDRQLKAGTDLHAVLALLDATEDVARERRISIRALIGAVRSRIVRGAV